jgi:hypothetical protein
MATKRLYTTPGQWNDLETPEGRANLRSDLFNVLEFPDVYGLKKRYSKGSKCFEVTVTVKRVRATKPKTK